MVIIIPSRVTRYASLFKKIQGGEKEAGKGKG